MSKKDEEKKVEEQATPEAATETAAEQATQAAPEAPATEAAPAEPAKAAAPALESLAVLADRHRVPSWQQAALLRYAGWADDKLVTDAEYAEALEGLKNRRIGGGRR